MKIMISSLFYKKSYGQGLCAEKLAEKLAEKGHKITVFHGEQKEFKNKKNLKIQRISSSKTKGMNILSFSFNLRKKLAEKNDFDVFYPQDYTFGLIDFSKTKKIVYHARGTVKGNALNRPAGETKTELMRKIVIPLMEEMDKKCCKKADTIIAASNTIKKEIIKFYKIKPKKIEVVSDGVDLKKFKKTKKLERKAEQLKKKLMLKEKKIILFAGRLVPQKGIQYLIKAMPLIIKKFPEAILLIAGNNTSQNYKKELKKEIKKNNLKKQIKFLDYVEQKKMPELICASNLIASPSTYEPIGIINLEAIALNKPVIIPSSIGSIETLRDSAVIVDSRKPEEISHAVIKIFSSKKLYRKLSSKGRINAKKVEWKKIALRIEKILRKTK